MVKQVVKTKCMVNVCILNRMSKDNSPTWNWNHGPKEMSHKLNLMTWNTLKENTSVNICVLLGMTSPGNGTKQRPHLTCYIHIYTLKRLR